MTMDNQNNAKGLKRYIAASGGIIEDDGAWSPSRVRYYNASEVDALLASRPAAPVLTGEGNRTDFLWPHEDGTVEQAAYEFANGKTEDYRRDWYHVMYARIKSRLISGTPVAPQDVVANAREFIAAAKIEGNKKGMGGYMFARMKDLESALDAHPPGSRSPGNGGNKMSKTLQPADNKFHLGNGDDGKHYWLTPPELYTSLNSEFHFDFDPCPFPLPDGFDGLTCEWGAANYVNPPFGSIIHQGKKKGPTAWIRKAIAEWQKGKTVVLVYPIDKWVLMILKAILGDNAEVRNLGDVRWVATEDGSVGKGTGRHIACFVLRYSDTTEGTCRPMKALLPLMWTAETIKDAPEGEYRVNRPGSNIRWDGMLYDLDDVREGFHVGVYTRAFGPIPQPPASKEEAE